MASVQAQGIEDIEILIVGDGVDDSVRSAVERLQAADSRIRFFDFPKGPRNGEIHRDGVLRQASGRIVCYQADDDLWLPGHFEDMEAALENAEFVGAMHVNVEREDRVQAHTRECFPRGVLRVERGGDVGGEGERALAIRDQLAICFRLAGGDA